MALSPIFPTTTSLFNWYSFTDGDDSAIAPLAANGTCAFTNGYSYASVWPKTPGLNSNNGIGRIHSQGSPVLIDRIYLRGGSWYDGIGSGVFALHSDWTSGTMGHNVGFRCAR